MFVVLKNGNYELEGKSAMQVRTVVFFYIVKN